MSVASEISRLTTAKAAIKAAIEAKGVTVPSSATLSDYAALIAQIATGGMNCSAISAASASLTPSWDTLYQWTVNPTSITINAPSAPSDSTKEIALKFTTGSTAPTMSFPAAFAWKDGDSVTFAANTSYEVTIGYDSYAAKCTVMVSAF